MDVAKVIQNLEGYENKWVAISAQEEKVVASGNDALEAKRQAESKGYEETVLFKVLPTDVAYFPSTHEV